MTDYNETYPGAFKALFTGYGFFGDWNYAHFPASEVPELSLKGDKPFTLYTTLCLLNAQGGAVLEQADAFQVGIMDGFLCVAGIDWCAVKFSKCELSTHRWYKLALVYDGSLMTIYLDGEEKGCIQCKPATLKSAKEVLTIGNKLDAYFKNFYLFNKALSAEQVCKLASGDAIKPPDSIAWFDFDRTARRDNSPGHVKLATKGFARIVLVYPVRQFRFSINRKYHNVEKMVYELFNSSTSINITGCIGSKYNSEYQTHLAGMFSLGTPKPMMCEIEGEIVTLWESVDIPKNDW